MEVLLNDLSKIKTQGFEEEKSTFKTWLSTPVSFGRLFSKKSSEEQELSGTELLAKR